MNEFLLQVNRFIYPELRRSHPQLTLVELARLASDGTEDLTKTRWQFSVLMRCTSERRNETWWHRVVKVVGIRAVVGHTAVGFVEDDRFHMPLTYI